MDNTSQGKLLGIAAIIASVLGPLAVAFVGNAYSSSIKDAENRLRYVEIALAILKDKPKAETVDLRNWAIEILNSQAVVPLTQKAKDQLRENTEISYAPLIGVYGSGYGSTVGLGGSGHGSNGSLGGSGHENNQ